MVFIILFAALSFTVPDFISSRNIQGLLLSVTLIGSISVTMMFVLALGEVDLVGGVDRRVRGRGGVHADHRDA